MWQQREMVWKQGHAELVRFNEDGFALFFKGRMVNQCPMSFDAAANYYWAEFAP